MKNLKKLLAVVLACTMVFGVVSFAATSRYPDVASDAKYAEAVNVLSALEIIKGDDQGNFNPDKNITRAEFSKILCTLYGAGELGNAVTVFNDVPSSHWASGYVNYANQLGFINGYGDGNFGPEDQVTYEQAIKMLVCAMGYAYMADDNGGYPSGYMMVAADKNLTNKVTIKNQTAPAIRSDIAIMAYNALTINMMKRTAYGSEWKYEEVDDTLLTAKLGAYKLEGVVASTWKNDTDFDEGYITYYATGKVSEDLKDVYAYDEESKMYIFANIECLDSDADALVGYSSVAFIKENDDGDYQIVALTAKSAKTTEFVVDDLANLYDPAIDTQVSYDDQMYIVPGEKGVFSYWNDRDADKRISTKKIAPSTVVIYNNIVAGSAYYVNGENNFIPDRGNLTIVDTDNDGYYDLFKVTSYDLYTVSKVVGGNKLQFKAPKSTSKSSITTSTDTNKNLKDVKVTLNGEAASLTDLAEDDIVWLATNNYNDPLFFDIIATRKVVEGIVEETGTDDDGNDFVVINGEEYKVDPLAGAIANQDEGSFYLGADDKIIFVDATSALSGNYAYIMKAGVDSMGDISIKAYTLDNGIVTFTVGDTIKINGTKINVDDTVLSDLAAQLNHNKDTHAALFNYTANDKTITKINFATETDDFDMATIIEREWQADYTQFKGNLALTDSAKIFWWDEDSDNYKVTGVEALVDETEYSGYAYTSNKDGEYEVAVILNGNTAVDVDAYFAVYNRKTTGTVKDEDAYKVYFWAEGAEQTAIYAIEDAYDELANAARGDLFLYSKNEDGNMKNAQIIYNISDIYLDNDVAVDGSQWFNAVNPDITYGSEVPVGSKGYAVFYGYVETIKSIAKGTRLTMFTGENFTVTGDTVVTVVDFKNNKIKAGEAGSIMETSLDGEGDVDPENTYGVLVRVDDNGKVMEVVIVDFSGELE